MAKSCLNIKKKTIFEIIQRFYAAVLLEMDESNVDTWEV